MRKLKKLVALILCVAIITSLCAFQIITSAAEEKPPVVDLTYQDTLLIEKLESFGVISNEYDPTGYVTRREMAKIIAQYMVLPVADTAEASPFYDVKTDDDAIGAISSLYNMGVITGDENKNFHPDNNVTYDEAIVFIINAIGHKTFAERNGGYPTGYHRSAIQYGMLKDLSMSSGNHAAVVIDIYKMLNYALTAATVETVYYGNGDARYTLSPTETFMSETYGIKKYRGKVTGNECTKLTSYVSKLTDEQIEIDGVMYDTPGYVYGYFLGYTVDYYVKRNSSDGSWELMYVEEAPRLNEKIRFDEDDRLRAVGNTVYYTNEKDKEKELPLIDNIDVVYNNQSYVGYGTIENVIPEQGYIEVLDNNSDGVYDVLFAYEYENIVVDAIDSYDETVFYTETTIDKKTGETVETTSSMNLDSSKKKVFIFSSDGQKTMKFGHIKQGNVLSILKSKSANKIISVYITDNVLNGLIEEYDSTDGYLISGKYYKPAKECITDTLKLGDEGSFYLDLNEKIVKYERSAGENMKGLGVMTAVGYESQGTRKELSVRIFTDKGEFLVAKLSENVKIDNTRYELKKHDRFEAALKKLTNNYINADEEYEVYNTYLVRYAQTPDKTITAIDMGGIGGRGNLNSMIPDSISDDYLHVGHDDYMLVRDNYVLAMKQDDTDNCIYARYQQNTGVIFATPDAGNLDKDKEYQIISNLKKQRYYGQTGESLKIHTDKLINYSAYTFANSDTNLVDAFVFRGLDRASSSGSAGKFRIVTKITQAVDEDGEVSYKLYEGNRVIGLLDSVIASFKKNADEPEYDIATKDLFDDPSKRINEGTVISVSENSDGKISVIDVIAEYDLSSKVLNPTFMADGSYIKNPNIIGNSAVNFMVGEFIAADAANKIITIKIPYGETEKEYTLNNEANVTPILYRGEDQIIEDTDFSSLNSGDTILIQTTSYCNMSQIIVFR